MLRKKYFLLFVITLMILALPVVGLAQGKAIIKPLIAGSWQADSNFYRAEIREREVYTYLLQPGIILGYETAKSQVILDYTLDAYWYRDQDTVPPGEQPAEENDFIGNAG